MKNQILEWFPGLKTDKNFQITSPNTDKYNCISWAIGKDNIWFWPPLGQPLDDDQYWPEGLADNIRIETFIQAMETEGFEVCPEDEELIAKEIALYSKNGECTHGSRQLQDGTWTSKLGMYNDIQHSTPR